MASSSTIRMAGSLTRLLSRLRTIPDSHPRLSSSSAVVECALSRSSSAPSGANPKWTGFGEIRGSTSNRVSDFPKTGFGIVPFWKMDFSSSLRCVGVQNVPQVMCGGTFAGGQQVRRIMVEVRGNDLDRAIRKWRRKCKEENLRILKDREYFRKPSEKRVLALKERDRRTAKRAFKVKLNWIMSRRQRGF